MNLLSTFNEVATSYIKNVNAPIVYKRNIHHMIEVLPKNLCNKRVGNITYTDIENLNRNEIKVFNRIIKTTLVGK